MAQDGHRDAGVDVEGDEQACAGSPGRVHGDDRHAGGFAPLLEVAVEVAGIDRVAELGGQDEPAVTTAVLCWGTGPISRSARDLKQPLMRCRSGASAPRGLPSSGVVFMLGVLM